MLARRIPARPPRKWPISFLAAVAAGMAIVAAAVWLGQERILAWHWRARLASVPDEQAATLLAQIGELDETGIPILVEALGSRREAVASGARRVLADKRERWENLPWHEASPRLAILAESLAQHASGYSPAAQRDAEQLALWVLRWRASEATDQRLRTVTACEKVLEIVAAGQAPPSESEPAPPTKAAQGPADVAIYPGSRGKGPGMPLARDPGARDFAPLTGGALPIEAASSGPYAANRAQGPAAADGNAGPQGSGETVAAPPAATPGHAPPATPKANAPATLSTARGAGASRPARPGSSPAEDSVARGPQPTGDGPEDLKQVDTLDLMKRLQTAGGDNLARTRAELAARGFSEVHQELAKRLLDPAPGVRLDLARRLPGLGSVDAEPWLLWLCEDKDAEVRAAAMGLLATTGDPALVRRVQRMAEGDADPRIRRQAEQIRQQQGTKLR